MSGLYVSVQLLINALIIWFFSNADGFEESFYWLFGFVLISGLVFLLLRIEVEGKERLFKREEEEILELESVEG